MANQLWGYRMKYVLPCVKRAARGGGGGTQRRQTDSFCCECTCRITVFKSLEVQSKRWSDSCCWQSRTFVCWGAQLSLWALSRGGQRDGKGLLLPPDIQKGPGFVWEPLLMTVPSASSSCPGERPELLHPTKALPAAGPVMVHPCIVHPSWAQGIFFQTVLPWITGGQTAQKALTGPTLSASRCIHLLS